MKECVSVILDMYECFGRSRKYPQCWENTLCIQHHQRYSLTNRQLLDEVEHDIMHYHPPKPKAEADDIDRRFDNS